MTHEETKTTEEAEIQPVFKDSGARCKIMVSNGETLEWCRAFGERLTSNIDEAYVFTDREEILDRLRDLLYLHSGLATIRLIGQGEAMGMTDRK